MCYYGIFISRYGRNNMLDFINCNNRELKVLENDPFLAPIRELFNKVSERIRPNVDNRTNR